MAVNYTTLLGFALPVTGTESGTWGTTVNDSITELVEDSIAATATASVASGDWTLTTTGSGATNQARCAILIPTGSPGVSRNIIAPSQSKAYIVINQSNAAVVLKGSATTGTTIATGTEAICAWNGSDFVTVATADIGNLSGTLGVANGGTGNTTIAARSVFVANTADTLTTVTPTAGQSIRVNAGNTAWEAYTPSSGTGDVVGPASATDNAIARFDLTTGKLIQNSVVTIADTTGDIAGVGSITSTSASGILTRAAATQDGVELIGRAGGTSSYKVTLTPASLASNRTVTFADSDINFSTGLGVAQGGTGQTSYTNGQLLIGNTTGNTLAKATLTGTTNQITVTNGAGSITLSTPQDLNTSSNVQFGSFGVGTAASGTSGEIRATNNVTAYYSSDVRLKQNIQTIPDAVYKVCAIGGKLFDWTDDYIAKRGGADGYFIQKHDFGVIAQDVEKVFPVAVRTKDDGMLAVDYEKLCALAFAAIAELKTEIENLKKGK